MRMTSRKPASVSRPRISPLARHLFALLAGFLSIWLPYAVWLLWLRVTEGQLIEVRLIRANAGLPDMALLAFCSFLGGAVAVALAWRYRYLPALILAGWFCLAGLLEGEPPALWLLLAAAVLAGGVLSWRAGWRL